LRVSLAQAKADPETLRKAAAGSVLHPLSRTLLLLTVTTGVIDAVSFLGLGRVFTANMTGNIVLLGFGIAGSAGLTVVAPTISLAAFILGSRAGGMFANRLADRRPRHLSVPLWIELGLITVAAAVAAAIDIRPNHRSAYVLIVLLAVAMGVRNATVRRIGVPDLTTTVLKNTISALATEWGRDGAASLRRIGAVLAMLVGALAGALLLRSSVWLALVVAAALGLVALLG
jgi:uncharacterized membrane protein YoaK (UPF0700 family)